MEWRSDRFWTVVLLMLVAGILIGVVLLGHRLVRGSETEILIKPASVSSHAGQVYIGGAVSSPGFYPWKEGDTLESFLKSAGLEPEADLSRLRLYAPRKDETAPPQRININRAEAWLLQALPEVGPSRANAIVEYRARNGPFLHPEDLMKVSGFGKSTFEKLQYLITVED